ncbi:MAG: hypothetical protein HFH25_07740 [Lachnospiraceae bacterium]|nr:hypothetical protein [Lachnospiraceae bacterium]
MLGKLIKHEFKAVNRLMIPMHLGLILVTIVGRFYVQFAVNRWPSSAIDGYFTYNVWENLINFTLVSFYVIALIAIYAITNLYLLVLRPRKNLFTDEGYLTHTLPVSASEHIFSKLLVAAVWQLIDGLMLILSGIGMPLFLLMALMDMLSSILIIYMCLAIGHSFNSYRILASIGVYAGVSMITNLLSSAFMALFGMNTYGPSISMFLVSSSAVSATDYFWSTFWFNSILAVIMGVGAFLTANYFMSKRLNLE